MAHRPSFGSIVVGTWLSQLLFAVIGFATVLATARALGPAGRGELSVLILVPTLIQVCAELGQESSGSHLSAADRTTASALLGNGAVYAALLAMIALPTTLIAFSRLSGVAGGAPLRLAVAGGVAAAAGVFAKTASGLCLGRERMLAFNAGRVALAATYLAGVLGSLAAGIATAEAFFIAWCASNVAYVVVLLAGLRPLRPRPARGLLRAQWHHGGPIHVSNVAQYLLLRGDQLLLAVLASTAAVGEYAVAVNLAEVLWYLPRATGLVSLPFLSSERDMSEKRSVLTRAFQLALWGPIALSIILGVAAFVVVPIVFGSAYRGAVAPLEILLPGVAVGGVLRVGASALISSDRARTMMYMMLVALVVNVALNVLLIPSFGASGAAFASTVCYASLSIGVLLSAARAWQCPLSRALLPPGWRSRPRAAALPS